MSKTFTFGCLVVASIHLAHAATIVATPADVAAKLTTLTPGDVLELRTDSGNYVGGLSIYSLNGTATQPITIRGPLTGPRPVIEGMMGSNVIRIRSSSYIALQNLEVNGMGREGFGVAADGGSCPHNVLIENVHIHDLEPDQQVVGIAANGCSGSSWNWTLRGNRIERVGTGMYLGNSDGSRQFFSGVIEYNTIVETIGYNIEIKHQNARPSIPGVPTSDARTVIRHNVFSKSVATSSTGANARPNLLVGHMPLSGPGQNDRYEIYGNFFFQNPSEALFQGEGNIYFYDNVLYTSFGDAVTIQRHNNAPRDVHVFNNTIVATGTGIRISGGLTGFTQEAFGNVVFASAPILGGTTRDNRVGSVAQAAMQLNNPSDAIGALDLFPRTALTGSTIDYASVNSPAGSLGAATDWDKDFNGATQPGNVRGAYVGGGANPGWKLALDRKYSVPTSPTVMLNANPQSVASGERATLTWTSSHAQACTASGAWAGSKPTTGNEQTQALMATSDFFLECAGQGGRAISSVTVQVATSPPPTPTPTPTPSPAPPPTSPATPTNSSGGGAFSFAMGLWLALAGGVRSALG